ncbi:hypothetical protein CEXT_413601 [Caerostris extrusa]|uniref:Uncharacterized protein n=1 Tax=Caerostris extrusa TaxID=172846 RepID=A0AAV4NUK4_CAEEX|nr:hypothetical protein CEXT_413601 [Caerostris extrusa]
MAVTKRGLGDYQSELFADIWRGNRIIITVADRDKLSGSAARDRLSLIKTRLSSRRLVKRNFLPPRVPEESTTINGWIKGVLKKIFKNTDHHLCVVWKETRKLPLYVYEIITIYIPINTKSHRFSFGVSMLPVSQTFCKFASKPSEASLANSAFCIFARISQEQNK